MKNSQRIATALLICMSIIINACEKDETDSPVATDARDKYTGSWTCAETNTKTNVKNTFTVNISKSSASSSGLILSNFNNMGGGSAYNVNSSLSGSSISIPNQTVSGDIISGSGTIANDSKINFSYTVDDQNGSPYSYSAVYTK
jgi:hypothetical protein